MAAPRVLTAADREALEAFLAPHVDSSVFLLANQRLAGFRDRGVRPSGTYVGLFEGDELVAVAAHFWNRNLILQAPPRHLPALLAEFDRLRVRPLGGLLGPGGQVAAALEWLGVEEADVQVDEPEGLYRLPLEELRVPPRLATGELLGRRGRPEDLDTLARWRTDFMVESLGHTPGPQLDAIAREAEERSLEEGTVWVVEDGGERVAMAGFNARLAELVQIGGVWTPPALRGRGYARAAVAAALRDAAAEGVERAILFTGDQNMPAVRAYAALGFRVIGTYRVTLLRRALWEDAS